MVRGNRAIRDHETNGRSLHLFEQLGGGWVRYVGDATYVGHHEATGPDRTGASRRALVFELALGEREPSAVVPDVRLPPERPPAELRDRTLAQLRKAALEDAGSSATVAERRTISRRRSAAIKAYVRKRAAGVCEACGEAAPFLTVAGEPYLEPRHVRILGNGLSWSSAAGDATGGDRIKGGPWLIVTHDPGAGPDAVIGSEARTFDGARAGPRKLAGTDTPMRDGVLTALVPGCNASTSTARQLEDWTARGFRAPVRCEPLARGHHDRAKRRSHRPEYPGSPGGSCPEREARV